MTAKRMKTGACVALCIFFCMVCCGYKKQETKVIIRDGRIRTQMTVTVGETVEEVLLRAEIPLSGRDLVSPERDAPLTDADTEIVISRNARITVEDNGACYGLELTGATVGDAFDELEIELHPNDYVNHSTEGYLEDGMMIFVLRRNEVTLVADGETVTCITTAASVSDFLEEQQLALDAKDRISPAKNTPLSDGMKIVVERVAVETVTEREPIAFDTRIEYSSALYKGESTEKTAGVDGEKEITYEVIYVNGKEEKKVAVSEKVIKDPVDQVIVEGTKEKAQTPTPPPAQASAQTPAQKPEPQAPYIVSKQKVPDCDGSGHGYYVITWSDGTVEYEDY